MGAVYTIGYQGVSPEHLVAVLRKNEIDEVVDVRLTARSRKRGFSKQALAEALRKAGIRYSHCPDLGCPKAIRDAYKQTGDFEQYLRAYKATVLSRRLRRLSQLGQWAQVRRLCLLCFEADATRCHRSVVAARAASFGRSRGGFYDLVALS